MKIAELRAKSKEELKDLVVSMKKEQFNLRMQAATGTLENQGRFKQVRKTIAQAKTLMSETAQGKAKTAAAAKPAKKTAKKTATKAKKG